MKTLQYCLEALLAGIPDLLARVDGILAVGLRIRRSWGGVGQKTGKAVHFLARTRSKRVYFSLV